MSDELHRQIRRSQILVSGWSVEDGLVEAIVRDRLDLVEMKLSEPDAQGRFRVMWHDGLEDGAVITMRGVAAAVRLLALLNLDWAGFEDAVRDNRPPPGL